MEVIVLLIVVYGGYKLLQEPSVRKALREKLAQLEISTVVSGMTGDRQRGHGFDKARDLGPRPVRRSRSAHVLLEFPQDAVVDYLHREEDFLAAVAARRGDMCSIRTASDGRVKSYTYVGEVAGTFDAEVDHRDHRGRVTAYHGTVTDPDGNVIRQRATKKYRPTGYSTRITMTLGELRCQLVVSVRADPGGGGRTSLFFLGEAQGHLFSDVTLQELEETLDEILFGTESELIADLSAAFALAPGGRSQGRRDVEAGGRERARGGARPHARAQRALTIADARGRLHAISGEPRVLRDVGPVLLGRELLIRGANGEGIALDEALALALAAFEDGTERPSEQEYPFTRPGEPSADATMWAGITLALKGDAAAAASRLSTAVERWLAVAQRPDGMDPRVSGFDPLVKAGRCAEELGEALLLTGDAAGARDAFRRAAELFSRAGEHERCARVQRLAADPSAERALPECDFLLRRMPRYDNAILGTSTAQRIAKRS